jgi:hypothetical protein
MSRGGFMTRAALTVVTVAFATAIFCALAATASAQNSTTSVMQFAVSGDSRDCGDVVMPAIAEKVLARQPAFYWHLGDFRKIHDFDEDMQHEAHGGVLPGWIVGTAGAVRYALPEKSSEASAAVTKVYGYLLGSVAPNGEITFDFERIEEADIPVMVVSRFTPEFVHWCFAENTAH